MDGGSSVRLRWYIFAVELEEDRGVGHRHCGLEDDDLVVLASFADPAEDLFH